MKSTKKILYHSFLLGLVCLFTTAFTFPWDKEKTSAGNTAAPHQVKASATTPVKDQTEAGKTQPMPVSAVKGVSSAAEPGEKSVLKNTMAGDKKLDAVKSKPNGVITKTSVAGGGGGNARVIARPVTGNNIVRLPARPPQIVRPVVRPPQFVQVPRPPVVPINPSANRPPQLPVRPPQNPNNR